MLRRSHEPALHRIVVNIFQLLLHNRIIHQGLRMEALLPHLEFRFRLMSGAPLPQQVQQPAALFRLQKFQDAPRGVPLEVRQHPREIRRGEDRVQVVVEDDPRGGGRD